MIINWQGIYNLNEMGFPSNGIATYGLITADNPLSVIRAKKGAVSIKAGDGTRAIKVTGEKVIHG